MTNEELSALSREEKKALLVDCYQKNDIGRLIKYLHIPEFRDIFQQMIWENK